ncbi:MAG: pteridine reductase [Cellvibrionaceae bacterium]
MANNPVAIITGGGRRIGAETAKQLHSNGYNIILHYRRSIEEAKQLTEQFNNQRKNSAVAISADLNKIDDINHLVTEALVCWGKIDVLINNASSYYPTPFGSVTETQWEDLLASNTKAPFFLSQALAVELKKQNGCIVNIVDIHADIPLTEYSPYTIAKAGNAMLTKSLARELAPDVRVNGVAPGVIIWPENAAEHSEEEKQRILNQVPLGREGSANDIARTVLFFVKDAPYITGQILAVDGGRSIYL